MAKYLGLDLSTQSLTALVVDVDGGDLFRQVVEFDRDLPAHGTRGGVPPQAESTLALVDPLMWLEALDLALGRLQEAGRIGQVRAVGVSAQQHGSVYLNRRAAGLLGALDPGRPPQAQLAEALARPLAPIWMDSSTSAQCTEITRALGGVDRVVGLTGSPATERFAGPQARKFWLENPTAYAATAHLALVSSFITSILIGRVAPLDCGDGLGMNLADAVARAWSREACQAAAPDLDARLPELLPRDQLVGEVSGYLRRRYGFAAGCRVVVGSGDNPSSLAGLGLVGDEDTRAVSLGTSDTYFGYTAGPLEARRDYGHLFGAADGGYMFLVCFKNGSLARQRVRDEHGLDWRGFSRILEVTPPGNGGRIMLPYFWPEITPLALAPGVRRFGGLEPGDTPGEVRAVAEAQVMSMYLHSAWAGRRPRRVAVTAGGSANQGLLRLIAQVFGAEVRVREVADSAALGAALRAAAAAQPERGLAELCRPWAADGGRVVRPDPRDTAVYQGPDGLIAAYAACEEHHLGRGPAPDQALRAFRRRHGGAS